MTGFGEHSGTGWLRQVITCRPGLAHRRLTPTNCREVLFDDVVWTKRAQKDHDALTGQMMPEGVEVCEHPPRRGLRGQGGAGFRLSSAPVRKPDRRRHGCRTPRPDGGTAGRKACWTYDWRARGAGPALPPLSNTLFTRDTSAWIYRGVMLNPMFWPARRPETLLIAAIYRFHPTFRGHVTVHWGDPLRDHGLATLEG
jgi:arginine deiminase